MQRWFNVTLLFLVTLLSGFPAHADRKLEGAHLCTKYFPKAERYHNIPTHWLAAIASTESGRYHKKLNLMLPWPWTINVNGKGYYFNSKGEAIDKIEEYRAKGVTNIDVGCMQVNLRYHGHAFANIHQALEPKYNVAYAARFLRENFDELRSWKNATSAYHSRKPKRGRDYFHKVYDRWEKVTHRLGVASDAESIRKEYERDASGSQYARRAVLPRHKRFQINPKMEKHESPRMKVISVSQATKAPVKPVEVYELASLDTPEESEAKPVHLVARPEVSEYVKEKQNGVLVMRPSQEAKKSEGLARALSKQMQERVKTIKVQTPQLVF